MAKSNLVWVELIDNKIVRILKRSLLEDRIARSQSKLSESEYTIIPKAIAVKAIRDKVYERTKGYCEYCGDIINRNFHLHERIPRGRGGEVSLSNCVGICAKCHIGPDGEHKSRRVRFGENGIT